MNAITTGPLRHKTHSVLMMMNADMSSVFTVENLVVPALRLLPHTVVAV